MKDFLTESLIDVFKQGVAGIVIGALMWGFSLTLVFLLLWGAYYLTDSSFLPKKEQPGVVKDKYVVDSHTTTTYVRSRDILIPITTHYPETYHLTIELKNGKIGDIEIEQSHWLNYNIGYNVLCTYYKGRFSSDIYIESISSRDR